MRKYLSIIAAALVIASCGGNQRKADDPLADSGRTQRTENLLSNLKAWGDSTVYLFGHQDDTIFGIGWDDEQNDSTATQHHSDIKSICNDSPALVAFDITGIEKSNQQTAEGIALDKIRQEVINTYNENGIVSLSLAMSSDKTVEPLAAFLNSLETPYGVRVPVLLRLRGKQSKELWQALAEGLEDEDVTTIATLQKVTPPWLPTTLSSLTASSPCSPLLVSSTVNPSPWQRPYITASRPKTGGRTRLPPPWRSIPSATSSCGVTSVPTTSLCPTPVTPLPATSSASTICPPPCSATTSTGPITSNNYL